MQTAVHSDRCPRCGFTTDDAPTVEEGYLRLGADTVYLPNVEATLVGVLVRRMGTFTTTDQLYAVLYPHGGIKSNAIAVHVARTRRRLERAGVPLRIVGRSRRGYRMELTYDAATEAK